MALSGNDARDLSRKLIDTYFRTNPYPYTRHHIDSYDQFVQQDMISIIKSHNPILILKDLIAEPSTYKYRVEIYVGGEDGTAIEIGTPTLSLQNTQEVRILYPNEARLRNLTYASTVYADIVVKITYTTSDRVVMDLSPPADTFKHYALFKMPIMLHSRYCMLNNKPKEFLREVGECPYDNGGYFIVDGAEKVLITRQEQAFNTLYITPQNDPKIAIFASIECLSAKTRQVKRIAFTMTREIQKEESMNHATILVTLPFVRLPVPLFLVFRALGFQSDEEILKMIFPDFESPEAKLLLPKLHASMIESYPFLNSYMAIQYIKTLTKGFSEAHVLDIIRNQLFIHMPNDSSSQALFLGDCVRKILRVSEGYDDKTDRDDTRNQRCLTSGFLVQELFNNCYNMWKKASMLEIGKEYNYNSAVLYKDEKFKNIFQPANEHKIFAGSLLNDMITSGFKGKWGTGLGEEKSGVLQALSRLSYVDFMSHCRRVILDFDTGMKLTGPRKLHTSQYGYFCTSETPTGASIGITKNLSIMTAISTASQTPALFDWLRTVGRVYHPEEVSVEHRIVFVPVYVNGGMFGYTAVPKRLTEVLTLLKRCGCLPYSVSISFSIRERIVYLYVDAGRPLRPLIHITNGEIPVNKLKSATTWKELVMGNIRKSANLDTTEFIDPLKDKTNNLDEYPSMLQAYTGAIEYIDPYEQNECFIINNPAYLTKETTHMEVHPSTIMSMMTSLIPFAPHNQSPRNQLSCSQSKQGLSIYATNWRNRFDNTAHVLCYGEMPITRTLYNQYLGEGRMAYGMNCILAIACWSGYNQEDGIVMNYDAVHRGMFRSMAFRSYEAYEEDDEKAKVKVRFGNPAQIGNWKDLKPGLDYSKLDDRGIIREGEYVDENTVIVGAYMTSMKSGQIKDASTTPQVWTRGRVEKVAVMVNNSGLRLVKIRVVQDRIPELGDKFCLTPDHDVMTDKGWKGIADITLEDKVLTLVDGTTSTYANPTELYKFDCNDEELYHVSSYEVDLLATMSHKMYVRSADESSFSLKEARTIVGTPHHYLTWCMDGMKETSLQENVESIVKYTGSVYCFEVPSHVFYVRRNGKAVWTGNSNRHGQKGTIGALLRGHDMPRTESGIVPDMIMNPHAIPSRMTIAQNLEQLLGKTAALSGCIGDGTSFMNDGSPQEAIGGILEQMGFEKYGNEVMYNGATGEQINAHIFIGPVYGMRLKHMVEDKWQARGEGRREMRTHQPTGGRGAQGGLKIGEMDRDAIIGHAGMAFVKESFMERSDGTTMPMCVACGMIPIHNPRLNISICPMCDGPVKYTGDSVNNLEILPPLGRPKSKIVQVEMPYSTKLLTQEQETFLNLSMRYITTSGVQRLKQLELSGKASESVRELPEFILPETKVPAYIEEKDMEPKFTIDQLRSMGASIVEVSKDRMEELDTIAEEVIDLDGAQPMVQQPVDLQMAQPQMQSMTNQVIYPNQMVQPQMAQPQAPMVQPQMVQPQMVQPQMVQSQMQPSSVVGGMPTPNFPSQMGGFIAPYIPSSGGMLVVDTSPGAMVADGIGAQQGGRRNVRRSFGGDPFASSPAPMMSAAMPSSSGGSTPTFTINKLE